VTAEYDYSEHRLSAFTSWATVGRNAIGETSRLMRYLIISSFGGVQPLYLLLVVPPGLLSRRAPFRRVFLLVPALLVVATEHTLWPAQVPRTLRPGTF